MNNLMKEMKDEMLDVKAAATSANERARKAEERLVLGEAVSEMQHQEIGGFDTSQHRVAVDIDDWEDVDIKSVADQLAEGSAPSQKRLSTSRISIPHYVLISLPGTSFTPVGSPPPVPVTSAMDEDKDDAGFQMKYDQSAHGGFMQRRALLQERGARSPAPFLSKGKGVSRQTFSRDTGSMSVSPEPMQRCKSSVCFLILTYSDSHSCFYRRL